MHHCWSVLLAAGFNHPQHGKLIPCHVLFDGLHNTLLLLGISSDVRNPRFLRQDWRPHRCREIRGCLCWGQREASKLATWPTCWDENFEASHSICLIQTFQEFFVDPDVLPGGLVEKGVPQFTSQVRLSLDKLAVYTSEGVDFRSLGWEWGAKELSIDSVSTSSMVFFGGFSFIPNLRWLKRTIECGIWVCRPKWGELTKLHTN